WRFGVDAPKRHGERDKRVEVTVVLNRSEKAVDDESDERGLKTSAHDMFSQIGPRAIRSRLALNAAERTQRRKDDDQKSDQTGDAQLSRGFEVRVVRPHLID